MRYWAALFLAAAALIYARTLSEIWFFTADDAYITFRHAQNLARHGRLTFNAVGASVDGNTSFLWGVILAPIQRLVQDLTIPAKVLGCVFSVITALATVAVSRRWFQDRSEGYWAGAIAVFLWASWHGSAIHSVSGMETALYTMSLVVVVWAADRWRDDPGPGRAIAAALAALATGLARPAGNVFAGLVLLVSWLGLEASPTRSRDRRVSAMAVLLGYVVPGFAYLIWRKWYYGLVLPLPFYVKVADAVPGAGLSAEFEFLRRVVLPMAPFVALGAFRLFSQPGRRALPAAVATIVTIIVYALPAPLMNFVSRFLAPFVPILAIFAAAGILSAGALVERRVGGLVAFGRPLTVLVFAGLTAWALTAHRDADIGWAQGYANGLNRAHVALGRALGRMEATTGVPSAARVLATGDAGAVAYYSGWTAVDILGLNEPEIALTGNHDPRLVLGHDPALLMLLTRTPEAMSSGLDWVDALYAAAVERGFHRANTLTFGAHYHLYLMTLPGSDVDGFLSTWNGPGRSPAGS